MSGIAATTGEESIVDVHDGLAVSTASIVTWVARPKSVFVQKVGMKVVTATMKKLKAVEGERITFKDGKVIRREKP
jgi:hypothetical protein